jgi:NAD-dependent SIR2 family protein deacetylase
MLVHSLPRLPSIGQKEKLPRVVYTVVECQSCHAKTKRAFVLGDYVTKDEGACAACKGPMRTSIIYSEEVPKPK